MDIGKKPTDCLFPEESPVTSEAGLWAEGDAASCLAPEFHSGAYVDAPRMPVLKTLVSVASQRGRAHDLWLPWKMRVEGCLC